MVNNLKNILRYDSRGYRIALKDPNTKDPIRYDYDAYGKLRKQTNARGQTVIYTYDAAGRLISEECPEMKLTYEYVISGNGLGQLNCIRNNGAIVQTIIYNQLAMPEKITDIVDGMEFATSYSYDQYGRLLQEESPSGFKTLYTYTADGYLSTLRNGNDNTLLWRADAINAMGQITSSTLGNGLKRTTVYDSNLMLKSLSLSNGSTPIDEINYDFNIISGNLNQRNDIRL